MNVFRLAALRKIAPLEGLRITQCEKYGSYM